MSRLTTQEFIDRARTVHGNRYGYAFSIYRSAHDKLFIYCTKHGLFYQKPSDHVTNRAGCPDCGGSKQRTTESFIESAKKIHKEKYDYQNVCYVNAHSKVKITCKIHGEFLQAPNHHLKGVGCPKCRISGFNPINQAYLYVLRSDCGRYMKIGITQNYKNRHYNLRLSTPFSFKRIELIEGPGEQIANLEKELLAEYQPAEFTETFDGYSEWRLWDDSIRHKLISFMDKGDLNGPL